MILTNLENLEELALDAKENICKFADDNNTDIVIDIAKSDNTNHCHIAIKNDDIYMSDEEFYCGGNEISIVIDNNSDINENRQNNCISAVVAVLINIFDIESDEDHILSMNNDIDIQYIIEKAEWYIDNGIILDESE